MGKERLGRRNGGFFQMGGFEVRIEKYVGWSQSGRDSSQKVFDYSHHDYPLATAQLMEFPPA